MARVTLTQAGEDVIVGGSDVQVFGTSSNGEIITVVSGNVRLDSSFNQGGDTVVLPGAASSYTAYRVGGEVVFTRNDGQVTLRIPIGSASNEIQFDGGDSRTLVFDSTTNQATLEGQAIGTSATAPTPLTPGTGGPAPTGGYDVINSTTSVVEGENGNRQLVFTIELDRAVTAQDGSITLNFRTLDGTASSASDYVAAAGQVTFNAGQRFATVTVQVVGDVRQEGDETLQLELTGAALRNGTELLNGVIINDDIVTALTSGPDVINGTANNDLFLAANRNLGAGDRITDSSTTDSDRVQVALDGSFFGPFGGGSDVLGGFQLTNVEFLDISNGSGNFVEVDLSGVTGLRQVSSVNSSDDIAFTQLSSTNVVIGLANLGDNAGVEVDYTDAALEGTNNVVVDIANSNADYLLLNSNGTGSIETVTFRATGANSLDGFSADGATALVVNGGGSLAINQNLSSQIRSIDGTASSGISVDFQNNGATQGVTVLGGTGDNEILAGLGNDVITTQGGDDFIDDLGGVSKISTGAGNDRVEITAFDKNDSVALGGDAGDVLSVNGQTVAEADLAGVTGATTLEITVGGTTVIGAVDATAGTLGEAAGIKIVDLNSGGGTSDTLVATAYTTDLTVLAGDGSDNISLGTGNDTVRVTSLDNGDVLTGNKGTDTIEVRNGQANVTAGSQFVGFEKISLVNTTANAGVDQFITLVDANAPTANGTLTVDASGLRDDAAGNAEVLNFNSTGVTAYSVNVTGGAAADIINTANSKADVVNGAGGADDITLGGGDTVNGDAGNDVLRVGNGNNIADGGVGNDTLDLNGTGNSILRGGDGNDTFRIFTTTDFNANDTLEGGAGTDALEVIGGTYADAALTNVSSVERLVARAGATSDITLGAEALEAGIVRVDLTDLGADKLTVAAGYTANLQVNLSGGDDVVSTGSGSDLISTGIGNNVISTGAGNDIIRVSGSELTTADKIAGGDGSDTIELDVTSGSVFAQADLTNVTGVERFAVVSTDGKGGDRVANTNTGDVDNNFLDIVNAPSTLYNGTTSVEVDNRGLTDAADSLNVRIFGNVLDTDLVFNIIGSDTARTTVEKYNFNTASIINFTGGAGVDELLLGGGDGGLNINFNGGGGSEDRLIQNGGFLTDIGFINLSNVEVLAAAAFVGSTINANLGAEAAAAGIVRVDGTAGNDNLTVSSGFSNSSGLLVVVGGGDDTVNAGNSDATLIIRASGGQLTAADILTGGRGLADRIDLVAGGSSNLDGATRFELISVTNIADPATNVAEVTTIDLGTLAASEVDGGRVTVSFNNAGAGDVLNLNGGLVAANITVTGGADIDTLNTGSGADIINGLGGNDVINAGGGADTVNGGAGGDSINGQAGNDTINGEDGADQLIGDLGNDTINGGAGNDTISGGLGADRLSGDAGADVFNYVSVDESRQSPSTGQAIDNRDTIVGFVSNEDRIDLSVIAGAQAIRFNGNFNDFASAQAALGGSAGDNTLDAVFVRSIGDASGVVRSVLFVDVDNNGQLDGNDLQIIFEGLSNNNSLTSVDIGGPAPSAMAPMAEVSSLRFDTFEAQNFA